MAFFDTNEDFDLTDLSNIRRSDLTITADEIGKLYDLSSKAKQVGYEMTVLIADNKLRITFDNSLATIETDDYECPSHLDVPTGEQLSDDVQRFDNSYNATDEITKKQKRILDTDTPLTSENVMAIEDEVRKTEASIKALNEILIGKKQEEPSPIKPNLEVK